MNDLKGHPFFQGVIWESLREIRVPFIEKKKKFGDMQKNQSQLDLLQTKFNEETPELISPL